MSKKVETLAKKIAKVNNLPMEEALKIAEKALAIKEEQKDFYLFNNSETPYKGVKKWFAEKEFHGDKKLLGEMSVVFISITSVVEESEKAVKLAIQTPYGASEKWYPKSVLLTK